MKGGKKKVCKGLAKSHPRRLLLAFSTLSTCTTQGPPTERNRPPYTPTTPASRKKAILASHRGKDGVADPLLAAEVRSSVRDTLLRLDQCGRASSPQSQSRRKLILRGMHPGHSYCPLRFRTWRRRRRGGGGLNRRPGQGALGRG